MSFFVFSFAKFSSFESFFGVFSIQAKFINWIAFQAKWIVQMTAWIGWMLGHPSAAFLAPVELDAIVLVVPHVEQLGWIGPILICLNVLQICTMQNGVIGVEPDRIISGLASNLQHGEKMWGIEIFRDTFKSYICTRKRNLVK